MLEGFKKYLSEEYGEVHQAVEVEEAIAFVEALATEAEQKAYIDYIHRHHNNIYGDREEWEEMVQAATISVGLSPVAFEVLEQLVSGPKFDGDVVSKNGKAELYRNGLAIRIANKFSFGDNAATHLGWLVYQEGIRK